MMWTGRIISGFCALFLLFDAVIHAMNIPPVVEAFAKLGYSDSIAFPLAIVEFVCIALYVIPRTSILGAIALTGYLGGATAAQVRIGGPFWFSVLIGVLLWAGLFFQDDALRALVPLRRRAVERSLG
ncbi:MAG: Arginine/ornithine antiporter ArcD [Candidatus Eremiobacteraeota bacterium]|nr:Arginine/ornithine antiporter ArcD [Candidatus Eremiobacteraeota bacterium]